jgi:hypothetical protein
VLSNAAEAPLLGETGVLYCLTRTPFDPAVSTPAKTWNLPLAVWIILAVELGIGGLFLRVGWRMLRSKPKASPAATEPAAS